MIFSRLARAYPKSALGLSYKRNVNPNHKEFGEQEYMFEATNLAILGSGIGAIFGASTFFGKNRDYEDKLLGATCGAMCGALGAFIWPVFIPVVTGATLCHIYENISFAPKCKHCH